MGQSTGQVRTMIRSRLAANLPHGQGRRLGDHGRSRAAGADPAVSVSADLVGQYLALQPVSRGVRSATYRNRDGAPTSLVTIGERSLVPTVLQGGVERTTALFQQGAAIGHRIIRRVLGPKDMIDLHDVEQALSEISDNHYVAQEMFNHLERWQTPEFSLWRCLTSDARERLLQYCRAQLANGNMTVYFHFVVRAAEHGILMRSDGTVTYGGRIAALAHTLGGSPIARALIASRDLASMLQQLRLTHPRDADRLEHFLLDGGTIPADLQANRGVQALLADRIARVNDAMAVVVHGAAVAHPLTENEATARVDAVAAIDRFRTMIQAWRETADWLHVPLAEAMHPLITMSTELVTAMADPQRHFLAIYRAMRHLPVTMGREMLVDMVEGLHERDTHYALGSLPPLPGLRDAIFQVMETAVLEFFGESHLLVATVQQRPVLVALPHEDLSLFDPVELLYRKMPEAAQFSWRVGTLFRQAAYEGKNPVALIAEIVRTEYPLERIPMDQPSGGRRWYRREAIANQFAKIALGTATPDAIPARYGLRSIAEMIQMVSEIADGHHGNIAFAVRRSEAQLMRRLPKTAISDMVGLNGGVYQPADIKRLVRRFLIGHHTMIEEVPAGHQAEVHEAIIEHMHAVIALVTTIFPGLPDVCENPITGELAKSEHPNAYLVVRYRLARQLLDIGVAGWPSMHDGGPDIAPVDIGAVSESAQHAKAVREILKFDDDDGHTPPQRAAAYQRHIRRIIQFPDMLPHVQQFLQEAHPQDVKEFRVALLGRSDFLFVSDDSADLLWQAIGTGGCYVEFIDLDLPNGTRCFRVGHLTMVQRDHMAHARRHSHPRMTNISAAANRREASLNLLSPIVERLPNDWGPFPSDADIKAYTEQVTEWFRGWPVSPYAFIPIPADVRARHGLIVRRTLSDSAMSPAGGFLALYNPVTNRVMVGIGLSPTASEGSRADWRTVQFQLLNDLNNAANDAHIRLHLGAMPFEHALVGDPSCLWPRF